MLPLTQNYDDYKNRFGKTIISVIMEYTNPHSFILEDIIKTLKIDEIFINTVKSSGDYNLYPTNSDADTQGLYIRDGKNVYWIEFRLAIDGYAKGLAIYRSDTPANSTKVISPNSEYTGKYASEQSGDIWLLNLNNFEYSDTPTGSPTGWEFKNFTGNIKINCIIQFMIK